MLADISLSHCLIVGVTRAQTEGSRDKVSRTGYKEPGSNERV